MALRLVEMVLLEKSDVELRELLKEHPVLEHRQLRLSDGEVPALAVVATLPHLVPEPETAAAPEQAPPEEKPSRRIGLIFLLLR